MGQPSERESAHENTPSTSPADEGVPGDVVPPPADGAQGSVDTTAQPAAAQSESALLADDEEPYVPRVFAFDATAPGEDGSGADPSAPSASPAQPAVPVVSAAPVAANGVATAPNEASGASAATASPGNTPEATPHSDAPAPQVVPVPVAAPTATTTLPGGAENPAAAPTTPTAVSVAETPLAATPEPVATTLTPEPVDVAAPESVARTPEPVAAATPQSAAATPDQDTSEPTPTEPVAAPTPTEPAAAPAALLAAQDAVAEAGTSVPPQKHGASTRPVSPLPPGEAASRRPVTAGTPVVVTAEASDAGVAATEPWVRPERGGSEPSLMATQVMPPAVGTAPGKVAPTSVARASVLAAAAGVGTGQGGTSGVGVAEPAPSIPPGAGLPPSVLPPAQNGGSGSPLDGFGAPEPARRGWVRGLAWTGVGVVVLAGLYAGAQWYFADKVPIGTSVAGVDIGGMSRPDAEKALAEKLGPRAAEPVTLVAGDATATLDPAAAGLVFDPEATAAGLTSFSMSPARLWEHLTGGQEDAEPVITVDDNKLAGQIDAVRESLEVDPVDGTVQFVDGKPSSTPATDGTTLDVAAVPGVVTGGWLRSTKPIELPTDVKEPQITQEETDAAMAVAQKVVSAPVVVSVGGQKPELPVEALAAAASFTPAKDGTLALTFDGKKLTEDVIDRTTDLLTTPDDAKFVFVNGAPKIEGGKAGTTIDPAALATAITTAASGAERTAGVDLVKSDPKDSAEALQKLGIKEKVSEFATPLTSEPIRTKNLVVGASKVNGTLVKPGETFSLTETLSPITVAGGYYSAGIVQDGKHVEGVGGGLSQMATTTYNAGFFAGLQDVEHRPHSYWFTRYPAGRESTMFVGSIDMRFKNDTPHGLLLQSWVGGGELHVAIWSTKHFTVEASASPKTNMVSPTTVTHTGADCVPQGAGNAGFSITNYRKVYLDGKLVKDESYPWTYKPDNAVVCK